MKFLLVTIAAIFTCTSAAPTRESKALLQAHQALPTTPSTFSFVERNDNVNSTSETYTYTFESVKGGIPTAAIIGIALGVAALILIIIAIICGCCPEQQYQYLGKIIF